eukprot:6490696-Amphidinium_carterae.2
MGKSKSSTGAKQGPAWSGKQVGKNKLVMVDEQSSSVDSGQEPPSRSAEKRRLRAERKAARKREGVDEHPVLVSVQVPQGDSPDEVLDRLIADQQQLQHPRLHPNPMHAQSHSLDVHGHSSCSSAICVVPEVVAPSHLHAASVFTSSPSITRLSVPISVPACVADTAQRIANAPAAQTPPHAQCTSETASAPPIASVPVGFNMDAVCDMLRSTVHDSMLGVHRNISAMEQRLLESISTLENRVRSLEANAAHDGVSPGLPPQRLGAPSQVHNAAAAAASSSRSALPQARSQSLYAPSRRGGSHSAAEGGMARSASLPRPTLETYSFFNADRQTDSQQRDLPQGQDNQEWRKRTVVLSGFETKRTIQEFKAIAVTQLRIPEGAKLLTRSKFAGVCSVEFQQQAQAKQLIDDFKTSARIVDQRRIYANPSLPPPVARRGWMLRAARRCLLAHNDKLATSVCTRSDTLFVMREAVFFIRGDKTFFTDKWPTDVCKAELLALFRNSTQGG